MSERALAFGVLALVSVTSCQRRQMIEDIRHERDHHPPCLPIEDITELPIPDGPSCGDGVVSQIVTRCEEVCSSDCDTGLGCEERCISVNEVCDVAGDRSCASLGFAAGEFDGCDDCLHADLSACEPCPASMSDDGQCKTFRPSRGIWEGGTLAAVGSTAVLLWRGPKGLNVGRIGPDLTIEPYADLGEAKVEQTYVSGEGLLVVARGRGEDGLVVWHLGPQAPPRALLRLRETTARPSVTFRPMLDGAHLIGYYSADESATKVVRPGGIMETIRDEPVLAFVPSADGELTNDRLLLVPDAGGSDEFTSVRVEWAGGRVSYEPSWINRRYFIDDGEPWAGGTSEVRVSMTTRIGGFSDEVRWRGEVYRFDVDLEDAQQRIPGPGYASVDPPLAGLDDERSGALKVPLNAAYCYQAMEVAAGDARVIATFGSVVPPSKAERVVGELDQPRLGDCPIDWYTPWQNVTLLRRPR